MLKSQSLLLFYSRYHRYGRICHEIHFAKQEFSRLIAKAGVLIGVVCMVMVVGCSRKNLEVQSTYVTYEDLASYHVGTPDPRKECPDTGQRLLVRWSLPKRCLVPDRSTLTLLIRYGDGEERHIVVNLKRPSGCLTYCLLNDDYFCRGGILTYKAYITIEDCIVDEWVHQIWTDKIDFG